MNWNESRLSRRPHYGKRTFLAAYNDKISEDGDWLHPTKGYRHIGAKRAEAIAKVAQIKSRIFRTVNKGPSQPKSYSPSQMGNREAARRARQMAKVPQ